MTKLHASILILLAALYIIMGVVILSAKNLWDLPLAAQIAFGSLCIIYGVYRLYRAYKQFTNKEENEL